MTRKKKKRKAEKPLTGQKRRIAKAPRREFFGDPAPDSDHHVSFIAGYTSGGAAYGIPWEETESNR